MMTLKAVLHTRKPTVVIDSFEIEATDEGGARKMAIALWDGRYDPETMAVTTVEIEPPAAKGLRAFEDDSEKMDDITLPAAGPAPAAFRSPPARLPRRCGPHE